MDKEVLEFILALTLVISLIIGMNLVNKIRALKALVSSANNFNSSLNAGLNRSHTVIERLIEQNEQNRDMIANLKEEVRSWKAKSLP